MVRSSEERKKAAVKVGRLITLGKTIREAAEIVGVSKSTAHNYIHKELKKIDKKLYKRTIHQLKQNVEKGHKKGGLSTRKRGGELNKDGTLSSKL